MGYIEIFRMNDEGAGWVDLSEATPDELFNIEEPGDMVEDQYMQVNQSQLATVEQPSSEKDAEDVADFIRPLLEFDPEARHTALQALRSPWLQD